MRRHRVSSFLWGYPVYLDTETTGRRVAPLFTLGRLTMLIEQLGFYLTCKGLLQQVIYILPDSFESTYPVIAINADGVPDNWRRDGSYLRSNDLPDNNLVRYLPTVKSFTDPIPPTVKECLTVDIPAGFVLLPEDQPKKFGDIFHFGGNYGWVPLGEVFPEDNARKSPGMLYATPAPEPEPPKTKTVTEWLCKTGDGRGFYVVWCVNRPQTAITALRTIEVPE